MMMILRLVFAGALAGVCIVIARAKAGRLELRSQALGDFLTMMKQIEALMRVGGRTIPDALAECASRLGECWTGKFASALAGYYGGRANVQGKWSEALKDAAKGSEEAASLTADDRQIISLFGDQLSSPDIRTIGENFAMLYERIGEKLQESDRDRAVKGRLYRTLGTLAGLAAAVVVL